MLRDRNDEKEDSPSYSRLQNRSKKRIHGLILYMSLFTAYPYSLTCVCYRYSSICLPTHVRHYSVKYLSLQNCDCSARFALEAEPILAPSQRQRFEPLTGKDTILLSNVAYIPTFRRQRRIRQHP